MSKLLVIGYVWPEPNSSAAGSRMMQLIESFQLVCDEVVFASPAAESVHRVDLVAANITPVTVELNNPSFDHFITQLQPDIVLFDRFMMEEQFGWRVEKCCPEALRVLDTEDLHFLRHARHQAVKQHMSAIARDDQLSPVELNNELAQREVAAILRSDLTLMISQVETDLLINQYRVPEALLVTIPFMLDKLSATAQSRWPAYDERIGYVAIGNFRHAPNWDAVRYLKHSLWPLIRAKHSRLQKGDATLSIYGAYPPPKATQLHNPAEGFLVKGWAEDALQVLGSARVCLAPLRFGAGIKGKLVDAMLAGTPSVTTSIGAESMHDGHHWPGAVADTAEEMAEAAVTLYHSENLWLQAQTAGVNLINDRYDKKKYQQSLLAVVKDKITNLKQHRLMNFTGAMLRNQSMKSTQYMAQWIEAKNRLADCE